MPVELFTDGLEPEGSDAVIWRFLELWKFQDLLHTSEMYFRRADLFPDESEGLPPEEYLPILGLDPLDIDDVQERNHHIASIAQFRESFYVSCWYLFDEETAAMWKEYGNDGVAICSRYSLLKAVMEPIPDRPHLGLVRYGHEHLTGWNTMRFITTKARRYAHEKEVRALLWILSERDTGGRHFDANNKPHPRPLTPPPPEVPEGVRRKVALDTLISEIRLNPWASDDFATTIRDEVRKAGLQVEVKTSDLAQYRHLLP